MVILHLLGVKYFEDSDESFGSLPRLYTSTHTLRRLPTFLLLLWQRPLLNKEEEESENRKQQQEKGERKKKCLSGTL
jgi:hypothetical protein